MRANNFGRESGRLSVRTPHKGEVRVPIWTVRKVGRGPSGLRFGRTPYAQRNDGVTEVTRRSGRALETSQIGFLDKIRRKTKKPECHFPAKKRKGRSGPRDGQTRLLDQPPEENSQIRPLVHPITSLACRGTPHTRDADPPRRGASAWRSREPRLDDCRGVAHTAEGAGVHDSALLLGVQAPAQGEGLSRGAAARHRPPPCGAVWPSAVWATTPP